MVFGAVHMGTVCWLWINQRRYTIRWKCWALAQTSNFHDIVILAFHGLLQNRPYKIRGVTNKIILIEYVP